MRFFAGLLVSGVVVSCQSDPAGPWVHEPAGFTLTTDYGWSDSFVSGPLGTSGWDGVSGSGIVSRVSDGTAPFSAPDVMQMEYPTGFDGGTEPGKMYFTFSGPLTELYVSIWWKASNPWQGHSSGVNKLAFLYTGQVGSTRVSIVPEMFGSGSGPFYLRTALFETGVSEPRDWAEPNVGDGTLVPGRWYRIEIFVKYGTSSSSNNGVLKQWVNGALVTNYTDLNFANDGFDSVEIDPTWGGTGDTKTENDYFRYDHIHISGR